MNVADASPQGPRAASRARPRGSRGFTLVELMIVVAIIGILAGIAIPAFSRYIKKSRTAEASQHINKMWAGSVTYYESDHVDSLGNVLPKQFPSTAAAVEPSCCTFGAEKCPGNSPVYDDPTWMALHFVVAEPHHYMTAYASAGSSGAASFTATASGDLDCDDVLSRFERRGWVNSSNDVYAAGGTYVVNELE